MRDDLLVNIKFCELVQKHPNLYDNSRKDYCLLNRNLADQTWKKIAIKFKTSINQCKDRWRNIRGNYSKYVTKLKKNGPQNERLKGYYLAPYLTFLDPFMKSRDTKKEENITFNNKSDEESIVKYEEETIQCEDNNYYENCESVLENDDCISLCSSLTSASPNINPVNDEPQPANEINEVEAPIESKEYYSRKRKHSETSFNNHQNYQYVNKRKNEFVEYQSPINAIHPSDPDQSFLNSVLPDMKSMNSSQKRHFKMGILNLAEQILSVNSSIHQFQNP